MNNEKTAVITTFDKALVAKLLLQAKGPHRTGIEFCKECGISAPTFSRYINQKNVKPCPVEALKKIAEHAAPDSNVTLEILLEANGTPHGSDVNNTAAIPDADLKGILTTAILSCGFTCQYNNDYVGNILGLNYVPSWSLLTTAIDGKNKKRWDFHFCQDLEEAETSIERIIRQILLIVGSYHSGCLKVDKISYVFSNPLLYAEIHQRIKNLSLEPCISIILLDTDAKQVESDFILSNTATAIALQSISTYDIPSDNTLFSED